MTSRYRKKPLAQFEHGTRIYAPSSGELRFRVVARDSSSGERAFAKLATEEEARILSRAADQSPKTRSVSMPSAQAAPSCPQAAGATVSASAKTAPNCM